MDDTNQNLSEDQKKKFKESMGSSVLRLKPNQLTKAALIAYLKDSEIPYVNYLELKESENDYVLPGKIKFFILINFK